MENDSIQEIWRQNEALLDNSRQLNLSLLKEVKLDKAQSSLRSLLFLPVSTGIFFTFAAFYALNFVIMHMSSWYFAFSGSVVAVFSIMYLVSSIKQLTHILSVDYEAPVVKLQKKMVQIKTSVITNLKIVAWALPFSPFIGLFLIKVLFNFDMTTLLNFHLIIAFVMITLLLGLFSSFILRALRRKNLHKKGLNWFLQGSGNQVDEALGFLHQIEEFEKEECGDKPKIFG